MAMTTALTVLGVIAARLGSRVEHVGVSVRQLLESSWTSAAGVDFDLAEHCLCGFSGEVFEGLVRHHCPAFVAMEMGKDPNVGSVGRCTPGFTGCGLQPRCSTPCFGNRVAQGTLSKGCTTNCPNA